MKTPLLLLPAYLLLSSAAGVSAQTLTLDKPSYEASQSIVATWTGGPGNSTDWVGIYRDGQTPGSGSTATIWWYVNGTRTATTGLTDGSVTFPNITLAAGNWVAHFLANDGYEPIAEAVPFTVEGVILNQFTSDIPVVASGGAVTLSWLIDLNGQAAPTVTLTGGAAPVDVSATDNIVVNPAATTTYTLTAGGAPPRSVTVYVPVPNSASFSLDKTEFPASQPLRATWSGSPGNTTDWIGIYRIGDRPGPVPATRWWYANGTRTATTGATEGSVGFPAPLAPGQYYAGLFLNDGYTMAFGPVAFSVSPGPFEITDFRTLDTGEITLTWFSDPAAAVTFDVKQSTDLTNWTTVEAASFLPPAANSGTTGVTFLPNQSVEGRRFYRVVATE